MPLKIDMHVHTCYSKDGLTTLTDLINQLRKRGLNGAAITDHDTIEGAEKILKNCDNDLLIIPGIETSTKHGHLLGINITTPIPKGLSIKEAIERIHDAGGISIAAHPYALFKDGVKLNPKIIDSGLDAIEVVNSSFFPFLPLTYLSKKFAVRYRMPQTAGSDSHIPETIGSAYTIIENDEASVDDIIEAIRKGLTQVWFLKMV
ncbi:CehA/McbA family metallohydrolase [Candidatus Bathyarchaeota archaeon]|nr:CehA/McbA family metallohydrolase [Candidatus Bathyarchaeota archaeon]